jgi:hypothetical protein
MESHAKEERTGTQSDGMGTGHDAHDAHIDELAPMRNKENVRTPIWKDSR